MTCRKEKKAIRVTGGPSDRAARADGIVGHVQRDQKHPKGAEFTIKI